MQAEYVQLKTSHNNLAGTCRWQLQIVIWVTEMIFWHSSCKTRHSSLFASHVAYIIIYQLLAFGAVFFSRNLAKFSVVHVNSANPDIRQKYWSICNLKKNWLGCLFPGGHSVMLMSVFVALKHRPKLADHVHCVVCPFTPQPSLVSQWGTTGQELSWDRLQWLGLTWVDQIVVLSLGQTVSLISPMQHQYVSHRSVTQVHIYHSKYHQRCSLISAVKGWKTYYSINHVDSGSIPLFYDIRSLWNRVKNVDKLLLTDERLTTTDYDHQTKNMTLKNTAYLCRWQSVLPKSRENVRSTFLPHVNQYSNLDWRHDTKLH